MSAAEKTGKACWLVIGVRVPLKLGPEAMYGFTSPNSLLVGWLAGTDQTWWTRFMESIVMLWNFPVIGAVEFRIAERQGIGRPWNPLIVPSASFRWCIITLFRGTSSAYVRTSWCETGPERIPGFSLSTAYQCLLLVLIFDAYSCGDGHARIFHELTTMIKFWFVPELPIYMTLQAQDANLVWQRRRLPSSGYTTFFSLVLDCTCTLTGLLFPAAKNYCM